MMLWLWIVIAVLVANAIFGAFLVLRFRAEQRRAADARHRSDETAHWKLVSVGGSSHRHLA